MNGAVFQVSAMTIAQNEAPESANHKISLPMILFITPDESKMSFHISAETIVGIAHGTKMPARTIPRPRNAFAMIRAIATPITVSKITHTMVMKVVLRKAFQKRSMVPKEPVTGLAPVKMAVKFCRPTNVSPPATRPVVGSTPALVWWRDSPEGQDDRDSGHHSDDDQGRRQQDPGQPALAIAQRVLLVLMAIALGSRQTPWFRSGCDHAATSFEKCAELPAQHLAAPGTLRMSTT